MPVDKEDVVIPSKLKQWRHLESIVGKVSQKENISVGLLIGANCTKALEPIDIILSKDNAPNAFKSKFGWYTVGPVNGTSRKEICWNWISVRYADTNEVGKHFFQTKTTVKKIDVKEMVTRLYNQWFTERGSPEGKSENGMSVEDEKFMKILEDGTKMVNKHYQQGVSYCQKLRGKCSFPNLAHNRTSKFVSQILNTVLKYKNR